MDKVLIKEEREEVVQPDIGMSASDISLSFMPDFSHVGGDKGKSGSELKSNMDLTKINSLAIPPTQKVTPTSAALRNMTSLGLSALAERVDSTMSLSPPCDPVSESRVVYKVKRFLSTLIKFGADISNKVGDKVKELVFNLVAGGITVSEFHQLLQDVTNFPLRPFVLPFLQSNIPLLQKEINSLAGAAKQSCLQYLRGHEAVLELTSGPEASEIFHSEAVESLPAKRKASSLSESGDSAASAPKRPRSYHGMLSPPLLPGRRNSVYPHTWNPAKLATVTGQQQLATAVSGGVVVNGGGGGVAAGQAVAAGDSSSSSSDEEWKNIHVMLNCILGMVEKTQRALGILQQRQAHHSNLKTTEELVTEVQTRAQLAVDEVKTAAIDEIKRVLGDRSGGQNEARINLERAILDMRTRTASGLSTGLLKLGNVAKETEAGEMCWNCGRSAAETCSGCNVAKYCGPFCQHKDWEAHHKVCRANRELRHGKAGSDCASSRSGSPADAGGQQAAGPSPDRPASPIDVVSK